eukprot:11217683-Lingulodinium_polyedra.AAC.1
MRPAPWRRSAQQCVGATKRRLRSGARTSGATQSPCFRALVPCRPCLARRPRPRSTSGYRSGCMLAPSCLRHIMPDH